MERLQPWQRKLLQEQIDPAEYAELERQRELADAAAELRAAERAKLRAARAAARLEPVRRRVPRERPKAPKPPPDFYKVHNWTPAQCARWMRRAPNRKYVAALRVAAFSGRRGWWSAVAMGVLREGIGLAMLADQRGIVRDVPQTLLKRLHYDRRTATFRHPDTFGGGLHRPDGNLDNGQAGYARLLVMACALSAEQYRKLNPSHPEIRPSCNFYTLCEPEIPVSECETDEETERTLAILELARIPHPSSGLDPRPPPHPPP